MNPLKLKRRKKFLFLLASILREQKVFNIKVNRFKGHVASFKLSKLIFFQITLCNKKLYSLIYKKFSPNTITEQWIL